jgi:hypothetical protein
MAANGLLYTAQFTNVSITNAIQDIWEMRAAATAGVLLHWVKLTFVPTITSGVAQDARVSLQLLERTGAAGTGGAAVVPAGTHPRNSVAAVTTTTRTVTTPGTAGDIHWSDQVSIIVPYELIFTPDMRIPISPSTNLSLALVSSPGAVYSASSTICFEEI